MSVDYSPLIEAILDRLEKKYDRKETYYLTSNPLVEDSTPSFQWFEDGWGISWNYSIDGESRFSAKRMCILTGTYSLYIGWALNHLKIPYYVYNKYISMVGDNMLDLSEIKEMNKCKVRLYELTQAPYYISYSSMRNVNSVKLTTTKKMQSVKKRTKTNIEIKEIKNGEQFNLGKKYLENRGLTFSERCVILNVEINKAFKVVAIGFKYPNGFIKIRFIGNGIRYMSQGSYEKLFETRVKFTNKAYVVEGEIDSLSILNYTNCDIFSMHNKSSLPKETPQLEYYDEIEFLVDNDKFEDSKNSILNKIFQLVSKDTIIKIRPKILNDNKNDFNSLLQESKLTNKIVETGGFDE